MKGKVWKPEWREFSDPVTGVKVKQLTDYKGHSHHIYFTNSGWYHGGRKLLIASDRENETNLFSIDLETGELVQLTEQKPDEPEIEPLSTSLNPLRPEAYFWRGRKLVALDLETLGERTIYEAPEGFWGSITNCTADGRFVCTCINEDKHKRLVLDYFYGAGGFDAYWQERPLSRILKIATDGSGAEVVWEERYWLSHVNTSPTQPDLLTFCHEGPWHKVDQRIWGLELSTEKVWAIRPRRNPDERVGHEYWLSDGLTIGYHGHDDQGRPFIGFIRHDNSNCWEANISGDSVHFHSNDGNLIVGDGTSRYPYLLLWRRVGEVVEGPRILARRRCSFHVQRLHAHARFSPDGRYVLFTADPMGYGNVFLVELPDFESLPPLEAV